MVGGQALDLLGEDRVLKAPELDDLHRRKTGALLTGSLRIGAIAAGAPPRSVQAMTTYGQAIGLAFQIADDVLDATSTAADLGKNPSDSMMGKSTYVTVHGLAKARERARVESERAQAALHGAGIVAPELHALATYVVERTY
jgi:geranylgeranyl pyrophosphate synthase